MNPDPSRHPHTASAQHHELNSFDGTLIFYEIDGVDPAPVDILLCDGVGCDGFIWCYLWPRLRPHVRIIHPHMRGHGRSDPPADPKATAIGDVVSDNLAVLDAAGSERVVICGHSMGVQVALETWHRAPERVAAMILLCGSFENPVDTFRNGPSLKVGLPVMRALARRLPGTLGTMWRRLVPTQLSFMLAELTEINGDLVRREDFAPYLRHLANMDPRVFLDMVAGAGAHSAGAFLGSIDAPVLVVSGPDDQFTPAWLSHQMTKRIPTAERLEVPAGTHTAPIEQPTLVNARIVEFISKNVGLSL